MTINYLLNLNEYSPYVSTDFPYDNLRPVIEKIADEIWTWSLPQNNAVPDDKKHFAIEWAYHIRYQIPACCVEDALKAFRSILDTIIATLTHCTGNQCALHGNHDFLEKVGRCIDDHISTYLRKVAACQEVMRRVN